MKICPICTNCGLCTDAAADIDVAGIINTTQPTKTSYSGCGIIVDIGTTTVYAACYDLSTGQIISQSGTVNKQTQYAPDVISRIQYAQSQIQHLIPGSIVFSRAIFPHGLALRTTFRWLSTSQC